MMRTTTACLGCLCVAGAAVSGLQRPAAPPLDESTSAYVERFLESADVPLTSYRAVRRLAAAARGGRTHATLTARTSFDRHDGFRFEVLEESGSGVIRSKVLRPALEAEARALNSGEAAGNALTKGNYDFTFAADGEPGLVRIGIRPRRTAPMLIEGSIVLTADGADLVSVEGRLVKRPSFWTRRVDVVRRYARLAGVRVPVAMTSVADVLFVGRSTFSMEYEYEAINGAPAPSPAVTAARF